ncbi:MAG TPA: DUF2726 domain-containing protein [Anaerolineales bacterium]|nr:DUF2726 domain-containing protein [Anaerolineales bacterium]
MPNLKPVSPLTNDSLPYRMRGQLLSSTELALYRALAAMIGGHYVICPKVALNDIFLIVRPNENVHYFNKIFRKHVDFLLCDPRDMKPAFGIELVKPIAKTETRAADQFMEDLFLSAGVPLVHVPSASEYKVSDLANLFQIALTKMKSAGGVQKNEETSSIPMCPVCGKMMVLRIHRDGPRAGKKYYGCIDSPRCAGIVSID